MKNFHGSHVQVDISSVRANDSVLQLRRHENSAWEHLTRQSKAVFQVQKNKLQPFCHRGIPDILSRLSWNPINKNL